MFSLDLGLRLTVLSVTNASCIIKQIKQLKKKKKKTTGGLQKDLREALSMAIDKTET